MEYIIDSDRNVEKKNREKEKDCVRDDLSIQQSLVCRFVYVFECVHACICYCGHLCIRKVLD